MIIHILFDPFINCGYMRRAIVACCILSISITPIGNFLMLRRMSLVGDVLSHAILPGVAIGYFFSGMSFMIMSIGGFISGLMVAILSNWISEKTLLKQDASFAGLYLGSLAFGVILMSLHGPNIDLLDLLFGGSILSVNLLNLGCIGIISTITLLTVALFYRALIIEIFDPNFLRNNNIEVSRCIQIFFLSIVMLNLVASFQVTGTLMSVGLMMLPGLSARCWVKSLIHMLLLSVFVAFLCSWIGLLGSFYMFLPAGPTIVLCGSVIFLISVLFGRNKGIVFSVYNKKQNL
ncbi:metal ABC transporter permease [Blochmannia endosymbiont of Camponotus sp. C-003]|uniref:metal ABC transporter permease n=1 Tax=unclassified Candidatus Blochmanniella TaxID=711328 RepID=UPI0020240455|nr:MULTISPECIES: metal ABC transporter permease [unclassified Candidatus Blochmannia]URJ23186.1 metal ABC transporter permease [Blochmannia endosymbiont of Camponotus sp. C-003]URJ28655.1 metal ABC transporter permease [Blochmannia endosymbiont of Camponotus sp. C-046]